MSMSRRWLFACCLGLACLCLSRPGWSVSDYSLIGLSDLIVVGTVAGNTPCGNQQQVTLNVVRVLKGQPVAQVTFLYHPLPSPALASERAAENHAAAMPGMLTAAPAPLAGQWLVFLQRAQGGWAGVAGNDSVQPAERADAFAALVKNFPLQATLNPSIGPLYFNQPFFEGGKVKNVGTVPYMVQTVWLEGYYVSPKFGQVVTIIIDPHPLWNASAVLAPVQPGQEQPFQQSVIAQASAGWNGIDPATLFLTPIAVRAVMTASPVVAQDRLAANSLVTVASPWVNTLVGFPPVVKPVVVKD